MLMRSLVVLSPLFRHTKTLKNKGLSLSLFPFSLFSRNRHKLHTNLLFYSFLLKRNDIKSLREQQAH